MFNRPDYTKYVNIKLTYGASTFYKVRNISIDEVDIEIHFEDLTDLESAMRLSMTVERALKPYNPAKALVTVEDGLHVKPAYADQYARAVDFAAEKAYEMDFCGLVTKKGNVAPLRESINTLESMITVYF